MKLGEVLEKFFKFGGVLDFTGGFGLKVSQVSAGFGCGEGYYLVIYVILNDYWSTGPFWF